MNELEFIKTCISDEIIEELTSQEFVDYITTLTSDKYGADLRTRGPRWPWIAHINV